MSAVPWHAAGAVRMAQALRAREVSATELVQACLARIDSTDATVNAFTDLLAERAIRRAGAIDASAHASPSVMPLLGVPFAVKNLFDIKGLPTRAG